MTTRSDDLTLFDLDRLSLNACRDCGGDLPTARHTRCQTCYSEYRRAQGPPRFSGLSVDEERDRERRLKHSCEDCGTSIKMTMKRCPDCRRENAQRRSLP